MSYIVDPADLITLDMPGSRAAVYAGDDVVIVFDDAYIDALGVASRNPVAIVAAAAVPGIVLGSGITVGGTAYIVAAIEPDGEGVLLLHLEAA